MRSRKPANDADVDFGSLAVGGEPCRAIGPSDNGEWRRCESGRQMVCLCSRCNRLDSQSESSGVRVVLKRHSSWFGFSLLLRPETNIARADFVSELKRIGFECRPIIGGNFVKNPVRQHISHTAHATLANAEYIDTHGLFIGNHHDPIREAAEVLADLRL